MARRSVGSHGAGGGPVAVVRWRHEQAAGFHRQAQRGWQHVADAVHHAVGGLRQLGVGGVVGHPARAEDQGFELVLAEHQRRQREAGAQQVADARVAVDARALFAQRGYIAVQGAQADAQFGRERGAGHGLAVRAQAFEQLQQAGGTAGHGGAQIRRSGRRRGRPAGWRGHGRR